MPAIVTSGSDGLPGAVGAPGWYGKLTALGDFATRRLPEPVVSAWDAWLSAGLAASQATLGDAWLDCFLRAPIWHFGLMPGVIDPAAWFGVMMPSVDRVGRYFPLTIMAPMEPPSSRDELSKLQQWLQGLHDAALATLEEGHGLPQLEFALAALLPPQQAAASLGMQSPWVPADDSGAGQDFASAVINTSLGGLWQLCAGESLWWPGDRPYLTRILGLPSASSFHFLLAAPA